MSAALLKVAFAGPLVTIQDGGRFGAMRFGVPASGPMDRFAHAAANVALGRPAGAGAIEVSLGGLVLDCLEGGVTLALAGGGFTVDHGGVRAGGWCVRSLRAGERFAVRPGRWGAWCTLAVLGDLEAPEWLESRATHSVSGLGGGAIATGAELRVAAARIDPALEGDIPFPVTARPRPRLRAVIGPQDRHFTADALAAFPASVFTVTPACDRMGMRLAGPPLTLRDALAIPSEPIVRGSVQVAGDGVATLLHADHQTTGGYPKIATVISCDLDQAAQLRPRDRIGFELVDADAAVDLVRTRARRDARYFERLAQRRAGV